MKPPASIFKPMGSAAAARALVQPTIRQTHPSVLRPVRGTFRLHTQSVLDYVVETLRKAW